MNDIDMTEDELRAEVSRMRSHIRNLEKRYKTLVELLDEKERRGDVIGSQTGS